MKRAKRERLFRECAEGLRPTFWRMAGAFEFGHGREDLLQEMLLKIWVALPQFREDARLSTWAYRVALNTALDWRRREASRKRSDHDELDEASATTAPQNEARDELERVNRILRGMREADRAVLLLALEERSTAEMAEILGVSENAASVRLHRARQRLSDALGKEAVR